VAEAAPDASSRIDKVPQNSEKRDWLVAKDPMTGAGEALESDQISRQRRYDFLNVGKGSNRIILTCDNESRAFNAI